MHFALFHWKLCSRSGQRVERHAGVICQLGVASILKGMRV